MCVPRELCTIRIVCVVYPECCFPDGCVCVCTTSVVYPEGYVCLYPASPSYIPYLKAKPGLSSHSSVYYLCIILKVITDHMYLYLL